MDMCMKAATDIGTTVTVPQAITQWSECVEQIRDAYEHIDERAVGLLRRNRYGQSPDALTIFDHERVVGEGVIAYRGYQLDLETVVSDLIPATRQYLKLVAAETLPSDSTTSAPTTVT